jgi:hypothetical protein
MQRSSSEIHPDNIYYLNLETKKERGNKIRRWPPKYVSTMTTSTEGKMFGAVDDRAQSMTEANQKI